MVLVDTPAWSFALRRKPEHLSLFERKCADLLYDLIDEGRVQLLGVVRQELLSGLREEAEFRRLRDYLRDFPDALVTTEDYENAARASNQCRRAGVAGATVDMLICAVALHREWEVLTTDRDFARYRSILNIQLAAI